MKIALLCPANVGGWYAASLMQRGYEVIISGGGAIHAAGLKEFMECDGCLLVDDQEAHAREIADYMEMSGKKIWRNLADVPAARPSRVPGS